MVRPVWFAATAAVVTALTVGFAVATARTLDKRLPRSGTGPIDPRTTIGFTRRGLYLNAAATQVCMGVALVAGLVLAGVRPDDLGIGGVAPATVGVGVGLGLALAAANLLLQRCLAATGVDVDDRVRRLLTPTTGREWGWLFVVVLPIVATFEEVLFRGVLVGAASEVVEVSPWLLVLGSAAVFAVAHGLQGAGGQLGAGLLGVALGVAYVVTDALVVVITAHYLVNVVEFLRYRPGSSEPL